jgi:hypothetical protein
MKLKKLPIHPHLLIQIIVGGFSVMIVVSAILFVAYQNANLKRQLQQLKTPSDEQDNTDTTGQIKSLLTIIGTHLELPTNEEPTVATILDPKALSSNPFFVKAEAGDKVIVYKISGKAILYRPSTKKIIETGSFNADNLPSQATSLGPEESGNFKLPEPDLTPTSVATQSSTKPRREPNP